MNTFLGEKLIREVQYTKTGFAICPASTFAQETLSIRMDDIQTFLSSRGQCKVEKPCEHSTYRLSGVPRSYAEFNASSNSIEMVEITSSTLAEALTGLTKIPSLSVLESRGTSHSEYYPQKSWIVIYPEGSNLSKVLPLFGVRVPAKLLHQRMKTPQCGKCFGWHNQRACVRFPRCRICASTQHVESGHTTCDPQVPHACRPKRANCHGPHSADSLECLIRPRKDNSLPSKQQTFAIKQAAAAARLRLKAAHCEPIGNKEAAPAPLAEINLALNPPQTQTSSHASSPFPAGPGSFVVLAQDSPHSNINKINE